jgi:hypothetical protein
MAGFNFKIINGEVVFPTDQERIADALAEIKDGLAGVNDPRVWDGYPDGWSPSEKDDEDDYREPVGLFLNLERCTRGDPSWQMAMAIRTAFELGRASIARKASKAAYTKLIEDMNTLTAGRSKAAKTTAVKKTWWHVHAKPTWLSERNLFPDAAAASAAAIIRANLLKLELKDPKGRILKVPSEKRIRDTIYIRRREWNSLPVG